MQAVQLQNLQYELLKVDNKVRFILGVVKGEIIVNNRKRAALLAELQTKGFTPFPKKAKSSDPPVVGADPIIDDGEEVRLHSSTSFSVSMIENCFRYHMFSPLDCRVWG